MHLVRIYDGSEGGGTFGDRSFIGSGYTKVTRRSRGAHAALTRRTRKSVHLVGARAGHPMASAAC
jgi:hypothetical protein